MRPAREAVRGNGQTYFVSSQTIDRRPFFRHERWALLMQEVLQHYRGDSYLLHAYVIMPDLKAGRRPGPFKRDLFSPSLVKGHLFKTQRTRLSWCLVQA